MRETKRERRRQVQGGGDFVSSNGDQERAERERGHVGQDVSRERWSSSGGQSKPRRERGREREREESERRTRERGTAAARRRPREPRASAARAKPREREPRERSYIGHEHAEREGGG